MPSMMISYASHDVNLVVHPTGWVDPSDPTNPGKVLAGELMRGVGGMLFNSKGERYVAQS